jgi:hypothetical protein
LFPNRSRLRRSLYTTVPGPKVIRAPQGSGTSVRAPGMKV